MQTPAAFIRGVRHPEAFHGAGVTSGFFEGWYIKLISADLTQRWAVIPGIFRDLDDAVPVEGSAGGSGEGPAVGAGGSRDEAFVQVLDGLTGRSWYHVFPLEEFEASSRGFDVRIGGNHFSSSGVTLDLPQLSGRLDYTSPLEPWPVTIREPGIMGWYGLVPFMECFHGIVSFGHGLAGSLSVEGEAVSFDGGRGYIEKDWGKAFPAGYVWLASNHFETDATASLVASVAIIPWLGRPFRGYIVGFRHGGRLHKWTTYNGSREELLAIDDSHVRWTLTGPSGRLELTAERVRGGLLHAPLRTAMHQRVEETLDARIRFRHLDRNGSVLLEGEAECAGMEVFGDIDRLLGLRRS